MFSLKISMKNVCMYIFHEIRCARTNYCNKRVAMTGVHPCTTLETLFSHDKGKVESQTRILSTWRKSFTKTSISKKFLSQIRLGTFSFFLAKLA